MSLFKKGKEKEDKEKRRASIKPPAEWAEGEVVSVSRTLNS